MSLFAAADALGLVTFAVSGYLAGVRRGLDLLGVAIAAFLTALGGGVVRDVIVGRTPVAFVQSSVLLFVMLGVALAYLFRLHTRPSLERRTLFILSDSVGLVAFALTGAMVALEAGFNLFGTMLLAFTTAVGGGMLRDMMTGTTPMVLTSDFYGTVALLVGALLYSCEAFGCLGPTAITLTAAGALLLRLVAWKRGWQLPKPGENR